MESEESRRVPAGFAGWLRSESGGSATPGLPASVRFHFFGLPVGDLSGPGGECDSVQKNFFFDSSSCLQYELSLIWERIVSLPDKKPPEEVVAPFEKTRQVQE